ncbi:hypothetical protein EVAR_30593_1 [Eumeta japonica]|uniref:Uncharacterized protein n=1 Tax=Eumeta variegata TaxID=151549 RepID=A0A4C1WBI6_EUMVA|nr:hypothetical protein EVAR_30593_1 [Eumeta japonica]
MYHSNKQTSCNTSTAIVVDVFGVIPHPNRAIHCNAPPFVTDDIIIAGHRRHARTSFVSYAVRLRLGRYWILNDTVPTGPCRVCAKRGRRTSVRAIGAAPRAQAARNRLRTDAVTYASRGARLSSLPGGIRLTEMAIKPSYFLTNAGEI